MVWRVTIHHWWGCVVRLQLLTHYTRTQGNGNVCVLLSPFPHFIQSQIISSRDGDSHIQGGSSHFCWSSLEMPKDVSHRQFSTPVYCQWRLAIKSINGLMRKELSWYNLFLKNLSPDCCTVDSPLNTWALGRFFIPKHNRCWVLFSSVKKWTLYI